MKSKIALAISIIIIIAIFLLLHFIPILREALYLIIVSFIISYALKPFFNFLVIKKHNKKFSAVLVVTIITVLVFILIILVIPSIGKELNNITKTLERLEDYLKNISEGFGSARNNKTFTSITKTINEKFDFALSNLISITLDSLMGVAEEVLSLAIIPVIIYYFLSEGDEIKNKLIMLLPIKERRIIILILHDIDIVMDRYVINQFMLSGIVGVLTFIILILLGINFPLILAIVNALFDIIPYFGSLFGAIPAILIALSESPEKAIYTAIWLYILQQVEGDIIAPKLTSNSVNMHPLLIVILLIIGSELGGFMGMVLAVPLGIIIKIIYDDLNYYLF